MIFAESGKKGSHDWNTIIDARVKHSNRFKSAAWVDANAFFPKVGMEVLVKLSSFVASPNDQIVYILRCDLLGLGLTILKRSRVWGRINL